MTVKLSSLRVAADMDSSKYVAGMKAKVAADQAGAASSEQVGDSVKRTQTKVNSAGDIWTRLSRQYVEGAGSAQKMQAALRSLQRGLDTGNVSMEQAETILTGLNAKLGLMANAEELAAAGQNQLAAAVARVNARLAEQPPVLDKVNKSGAMSRQLMFQLVDIGQAIPEAFTSPTYALQNFGFQIAQIGQLYAGNGGMKAALTDAIGMVGRFAGALLPIAAIVGGVALAVAGLTSQLDRDTGKNITFMETLKAVGQALWANLTGLVGPAIKQVGTWFGDFLSFILPSLKTAGNAIIGTFVAAFTDIRKTWALLPSALGDLAYQGAQSVVNAVHDMLAKSGAAITQWIAALGPALQVIPGGSALLGLSQSLTAAAATSKAPTVPNPFAGSAKTMAGAFPNAYGTDYLGNFYGQVKDFALQNYAADQEKLGKATKGANDNLKQQDGILKSLQKTYDGAKSVFQGFFADIKSGIGEGKTLWQALADAALNALNKITDKLLDMATSNLFDSLFGTAAGAASTGGNIFSTIFSALGFSRGGVFESARLQAFAQGGVVNRPTVFPFASGVGLMGEAGPEAIMPLRRTPDGRLGVAAANSNGPIDVHVTVDMDANGNWVARVDQVSRRAAGVAVQQAAPRIVSAANASAPAAVAQYRAQRAGSDYRVA